MRTILSWILIVVLLVGGAYFGSPWWTVWNLERAAKAGDSHAVSQLVDFPAVRASLTPELTVQLQQALDHEKDKPHTLLEKFTLFATKLFVPKAVDTLVTPEGVTYMVKTGAAPSWSNPFKREKALPAGEPTFQFMKTGYAGDDLDQFHATLGNKTYAGRGVSLKLLRRGFLTWKVVGIDLVKVPVTAPTGSSASYAPANNTATAP